MADSITWLHLSDRHIAGARTELDATAVTASLIKDLHKLQKDHDLVPDLLFFTGDLAWGETEPKALSQQFKEGAVFLDSIRKAYARPISKKNTFVVPGNHDVNRQKVPPYIQISCDAEKNPEWANELFASSSPKPFRDYLKRLSEFRAFMTTHGYSHCYGSNSLYASTSIFATRKTVGKYSIGIAGFNTAWCCSKDGEYGRLWSGAVSQARRAYSVLSKSKLANFNIALLHHPPAWLHEYEGHVFWRDYIEQQYLFALHGHEHDAYVREIGFGRHVTISAGACYEKSKSTKDTNGYSIVRVFPDERRGEVFLRTYTSKKGWTGEEFSGRTDSYGKWSLKQLNILSNSTKGARKTKKLLASTSRKLTPSHMRRVSMKTI